MLYLVLIFAVSSNAMLLGLRVANPLAGMSWQLAS